MTMNTSSVTLHGLTLLSRPSLAVLKILAATLSSKREATWSLKGVCLKDVTAEVFVACPVAPLLSVVETTAWSACGAMISAFAKVDIVLDLAYG
jgi:hypothetical protein